jgi:type IV pilus assembly protein PilP
MSAPGRSRALIPEPIRGEGTPVSARRVTVCLVAAGAMLAGCGANHEELQLWMEQQRREVKPNVPPLSPPKKFDPQPYAAAQTVEPFSNQKLTVAIKQESRQPSSLLAGEVNRRKEPLESFPLDSMSMVGSLARGSQPFALLRVDNLLYQVKVGDYLGQNYGRITKIAETEIALREIVQDAAGEWIERTSTLQLQEKAR